MIRVGVGLLPEVNPAIDDRWSAAEQLGFAHAWCFDHLAWRSLADSDWHATVPVLAAAALSTTSIGIGTFVASPNFRHPVPFAKDVMTLDVMSGGRLRVAIGAGAPGFDASMLGQPTLSPGARQRRFEEFVDLLDRVLRQPATTWSGEWFSAVEARTVPAPVQRPRPPLVVAANGPKGIRLAACVGDGWVTTGSAPWGAEPDVWWPGVADAVRRFEDSAPPADAPRYLDLMAGAGPAESAAKLRDDIRRAGALGFTDVVVAWPRDSGPFAGSREVLDAVAADLVDGALPD